MEKLKWILIVVLLAVLLFIVFFSSDKEEIQEQTNSVEFSVQHFTENYTPPSTALINEGNYILNIKDAQIITNRAFGYYLKFSVPFNGKEMVFVCNLVDTSGVFKNAKFPFRFTTHQYSFPEEIEVKDFYRTYILLGYEEKMSPTFIQENTIPFSYLLYSIKNFEIHDTTFNLNMSFMATHSELLEDVFQFRYMISGKISLTNQKFTERELQFSN